jgi:hydroxymethylpyrimidine pyrophosphatase-like HAD family hydrolase
MAIMKPETSALDRSFRIIAFDWDGTAVEDRQADAHPVASRLETLMKLGVYIVVITGTNFKNIDRQFCRLITGTHKLKLYVLTNRGSEVYGFNADSQPVLIYVRQASERENQWLTKVADGVRDWARDRAGLKIGVVYDRLNRRKIDMIPEPEWADPPKSRIGELLQATEERLKRAGIAGGIKQLYALTEDLASQYGLERAKLTSDVKFIEVGLTDKADSVEWVIKTLAPSINATPADIVFLGDEFGPIAGFDGSDFKMVTESASKSLFVSVGKEPKGVPPQVLHIGGGPEMFLKLMDRQIEFSESNQQAKEAQPQRERNPPRI